MPRMKHAEHGYTNCGDHEVADLEKTGWKIETDAEFAAIIAAKMGKKSAAAVAEPMQGSQTEKQPDAIPVFVPEKRSYFKKQRDEG